MAFIFGAGDLARGGVNTQLLILSSVGLMMVWTIRPIGKNGVSEGFEIQLSFPCGTEDAVLVRLIQDSNCTASAAYTLGLVILATSIRIGGVETSSVVTSYGGDLVAKACRTYCVRPAGRCRGMSSASYGLAQGLQCATVTRGLAAGPEIFEGRSKYSSLSPSGRSSGVLLAEEGSTAIILKGSVQFSESFPLRTLLSAPFRKSWRIVAAVL